MLVRGRDLLEAAQRDCLNSGIVHRYAIMRLRSNQSNSSSWRTIMFEPLRRAIRFPISSMRSGDRQGAGTWADLDSTIGYSA